MINMLKIKKKTDLISKWYNKGKRNEQKSSLLSNHSCNSAIDAGTEYLVVYLVLAQA